MSSLPPPPSVLAAFGVPGARPVPLGGGQGTAWRVGEVVLKPADVGRDELEWQARIHSQVRCDGFRLSRVRTAIDGSLCTEGWYATQYLAGWHGQRRWPEILAAGERLHAALVGIARPPFLDQRSSPWTEARIVLADQSEFLWRWRAFLRAGAGRDPASSVVTIVRFRQLYQP